MQNILIMSFIVNVIGHYFQEIPQDLLVVTEMLYKNYKWRSIPKK